MRIVLILTLACGVILPNASAMAAVISPIQDTGITQHSGLGGPDSNHGTDSSFYAIGAGGFLSYPLIQFDLTPFAGQNVVGPGTFSAYVLTGQSEGAPRQVSVRSVLVSWSDSSTTYNTFGASPGVQDGSDVGPVLDTQNILFTGPSDARYVDWTIPASVLQGWIDDPSSNFGLLIDNQTSLNQFDLAFYSMEGDNVPQLSFTVPEPASIAALVTCAGALLLRTRRTRRIARAAD